VTRFVSLLTPFVSGLFDVQGGTQEAGNQAPRRFRTPAGEKGAAQAAYFGERVALVERAAHLGWRRHQNPKDLATISMRIPKKSRNVSL
jgi:hypothetical protein